MSVRVMRTPRSLDLEITSRCNASCAYCYYKDNPEVDYGDLPTARWLALIEELGAAQVMEVTLQGGEPLLRPDFTELVDAVVAHHMRFSVLTNGLCLTPAIAEHLEATGRCNSIQVSLDGSTASVHESLRGPGTFEPALQAINLLLAVGLPVTVRATVHPGNIDDLPNLARLLLDELGLPSFSTNAASSLGSAEKYGEGVLLKPADRLRAMQVLSSLERDDPGRIHASAGPLADWQMFQAMETARKSGQPIPGRGHLVGCGCIFDRLAVRADGAYVPCVMLPQEVLGRIGEKTLADVWQNAASLQAMRRRTSIPLETFDACRDCAWRESCTGNCPGTAYTRTGQMDRPCPDTCLKNFINDLAAEGLSLWP